MVNTRLEQLIHLLKKSIKWNKHFGDLLIAYEGDAEAKDDQVETGVR